MCRHIDAHHNGYTCVLQARACQSTIPAVANKKSAVVGHCMHLVDLNIQ